MKTNYKLTWFKYREAVIILACAFIMFIFALVFLAYLIENYPVFILIGAVLIIPVILFFPRAIKNIKNLN